VPSHGRLRPAPPPALGGLGAQGGGPPGSQHPLPALGARSAPAGCPAMTGVPPPRPPCPRETNAPCPGSGTAALLSRRHKGAERGGGRGAAGCRHGGLWAALPVPPLPKALPGGPTAPHPAQPGCPERVRGAPGGSCCHRRGGCRCRRAWQGDAGPGLPGGDPHPWAGPGDPRSPRGGAGRHPHPQRRPAAGHRAQT